MVKRLDLVVFSVVIFFSNYGRQAYAEQGVFSFGSLGDSITTGFNSTGWGNRLRDSWAVGTSSRTVLSHFLRLQNGLSEKILVNNEAQTGARSRDIIRQAKALAIHKPDYVTLLIGGNDVCSWNNHSDVSKQLNELENNVNSAVTRLIDSNAQVKILMVPIPDLVQLWVLGRSNNCQWIWDTFGICKPLFHSERTDIERQLFQKNWLDANERLYKVAKRYPDNIRFDLDLAKLRFEWQHVSGRDCFHPSGEGQAYLAEQTWKTGWFTHL